MKLRARDVLGLHSPLARSLVGYEERQAQLRMADAVEEALALERPLFVEAGTGTGKTLAYLVPAILSGKKVVISTATRALQDQIFNKDLPMVRAALASHGVTFRAALMKGLTNYLCKRRLDELGGSSGFAWEDPEAGAIEGWAKTTRSGDRAELATLREDAGAWRNVQSSSETRIGAGCKYFDECFVTGMRREAEDAHLLVVNHHLFFADLALRTGTRDGGSNRGEYASVLPGYDAVVFDEAHEVEDIATDFFGVRISNARLESLARDAGRALASGAATLRKPSSAAPLAEQLALAARGFFDVLGVARRGSAEARRVLRHDDWSGDALAAAAKLDAALAAVAAEGEAKSKGADAAMQVARRARDARADLREIARHGRPDADVDDSDAPAARVAWVHSGARSTSVGVSLVEVGGVLRGALFDRVPSVICTSATLATATSGSAGCHFARGRLGAPAETEEMVLPSPFDFATRSALYLPRDLPEPSDPAFDVAAADRACELVRMTGGGAFVLCTSTRAMRRLHEALRSRLGEAPLLQGDAPNQVLLDRFKRAGDAVLVATMSFWEGVDVPGHALRLVIIDKIPFSVPTDPVVMARCAVVEQGGGNPFMQYSVPSAAITLKQGFGRLIRSQKDVGVVAVLDRRLTTRAYGRSLIDSLPPARRVTSLHDLRGFWVEVMGRCVNRQLELC